MYWDDISISVKNLKRRWYYYRLTNLLISYPGGMCYLIGGGRFFDPITEVEERDLVDRFNATLTPDTYALLVGAL